MIKDLKLTPFNDPKNKVRATFNATTEEGSIFEGAICYGKEKLKAVLKGIKFMDKELKREYTCRVLTTYVINHCVDDYQNALR